ncbi:TPA: hypothetical protein ACGU4W_001113 [Vibrio vulnificus]|nr:hypothetical protein [Vibrio vulnificus]
MGLYDKQLVDSNFRKYHLSTIQKWCNGEREGLVLESVLYSLEILKNCENFTLSEIAQNTGLTLEQICKLNAELLLQR